MAAVSALVLTIMVAPYVTKRGPGGKPVVKALQHGSSAAPPAEARCPEKWAPADVGHEFYKVLAKLAQTDISFDPFAHLRVDGLFSDCFYEALMDELPPHTQYHPMAYAGTSPSYREIDVNLTNSKGVRVPQDCHRKHRKQLPGGANASGPACYYKTVQLHSQRVTTGLGLKAASLPEKYPLWSQVFRLVHSANFTSLLVGRFMLPGGDGIPMWKRGHIRGAELRNSASLRIEPEQYHLTPHIDLRQKVVTWQFFHPRTSELEGRGVGTMFYKPKPGAEFVVDDTQNPEWLDYGLFDVVREQPVRPNYFFAFAPNAASFHGASITEGQLRGVDAHARRTFLGFVCAREDGFHHFGKDDWVDETFYLP